MVKAVQWLFCTYLVLKLLQYFFVARSGFGTVEPGFRKRLLRGEPVLFAVACAISIPAALGSSWYFQRGYQRGLEHSADCYGKLSALRHLRDVETEFDALRVFRSVQAARQAVSLAAQSLELAPDEAKRLMADKSSFYTRRYATLTRQGDGRELRAQAAAIERCMSEPLISF